MTRPSTREFHERRRAFVLAFLAEPVGTKVEALAITAGISIQSARRAVADLKLMSVVTGPEERRILAERRAQLAQQTRAA